MKNILSGKFRFVIWLTVFSVLLLCIPITIHFNFIGVAKVTGVCVIVLLFIALSVWRHQTLKMKAQASPAHLNANDRFWLKQHIVFYRYLSPSDRLIFENRLGLFFANVEFRAARKDLLEKSAYLYVASAVVMSFWPLHFMDYQKISVITLHESLDEMFNIRQEEEKTLSVKFKVDVSMAHLANFFKQSRISEEEIVQLKFFLKGDSVSPLSFASVVCPEWITAWVQLVDFTSQNDFYSVLQKEYKKNENEFSVRFPELSKRING